VRFIGKKGKDAEQLNTSCWHHRQSVRKVTKKETRTLPKNLIKKLSSEIDWSILGKY